LAQQTLGEMAGRIKNHLYKARIVWKGNLGSGTSDYRSYSRDHQIAVPGKPEIPGSSDTSFLGAPDRLNPEELMVSALSACHMLWYLHLCAESGVIVTAYEDEAQGWMEEMDDGSGKFTLVRLQPEVTVPVAEMVETAAMLHRKAHKMCFIANSVNFAVEHSAIIKIHLQKL
jgi:organic hydroperoxide reductase OsmC/OhrA